MALTPETGPRTDNRAADDRALEIANTILFPSAAKVDSAGIVPTEHLQALRQANLWGIAASESSADRGRLETTHQALASGCGATAFVWAQHHHPLRAVAASPNEELRNYWFERLRSGSFIAGIGFSHLRRSGSPLLSAKQAAGGGYVVNGTVPWLTSWRIANVFMLGARLADNGIIWLLLGPSDVARTALQATPLSLSVFQATGTVRLDIHDWYAPAAAVVSIQSARDWELSDRLATARPSSGALGVAYRCRKILQESPFAQARAAGESVEDSLKELGLRSISLSQQRAQASDLGGSHGHSDLDAVIERSIALRTDGLLLAHSSAAALVASFGGRAMESSHPAQRLAREASFYIVQAQTAASRLQALERLNGDIVSIAKRWQ